MHPKAETGNMNTPILDEKLVAFLTAFARGNGRLTVMTGAGISAESGIPTFRGPEGYWTVGAKAYHPQKMATLQMFHRQPEQVWQWYLYRLGICRQASPNAGHLALAALEKSFGDRFALITQNVDSLHLRAGNSRKRTFEIHGNISFMRCTRPCRPDLIATPVQSARTDKHFALSDADRRRLRCPYCQAMTRPHVLWFDECYDEAYFKLETSLRLAAATDLLLIVGTSGTTNLPNQVAAQVQHKGAVIVNVDIATNPFSQMAANSAAGFWVKAPGSRALPAMAALLAKAVPS